MDKKKKNQFSENDPKEKKDPKESIPLWLQGLSERQTDEERSESDVWQKEEFLNNAGDESDNENVNLSEDEPAEEDFNILDEIEEEPTEEAFDDMDEDEEEPTEEIFEIMDEAEEESDQDELPDWLNELADVNPETPEISGQKAEPEADLIEEVDEEDEITEEVNLEPLQNNQDMEELGEEPSPGQENIINEFSSVEKDESSEVELIPENVEIPEWLREMIAAEERQNLLENQELAVQQTDEPTKPVKIAEDQDLPEVDIAVESVIEESADQVVEIDDGTTDHDFKPINGLNEEIVIEDENITEAVSLEFEPVEEIEKPVDQPG